MTDAEFAGISRRTMLRALGVGVVGGAAAVATTGNAVAVSAGLTANDVAIDTPDGEASRVYVEPNINVSWDGFDESVTELTVTIDVQRGDSLKNVFLRSFAGVSGQSGTWVKELPKVTVRDLDLIQPHDSTGGGQSGSETLRLQVAVASPSTSESATDTATFEWAVNDTQADVHVSANANTGIET